MDFNQLVTRARAILTAPKTEWPAIAARPETVQSLYRDYILLLAAIPALANFIHATVLGISLPLGGTYRVGFVHGLVTMLISYAISLAGIYVLALVIDALAPNFGGTKDRVQALKTVAYALTASAVGSIGWLVPAIGGLIVLAGSIYSLYLLYLGLPITMKAPPEKALGYTGLVIAATVVIGILFGVVAGAFGAGAGGFAARDEVHFDKNSVLGQLEERSKKIEAAQKDLDSAQKSGDAEAQKAAMGKMVGAALGSDGAVESLAPDKIKTFLPGTLGGLPRTDISAERNAAMGMQISNARATYSDGAQQNLNLEITDMGSAKGFATLASWAGVEQEKETESGYEKTYKADGRTVHEEWNSQTKDGEYSLIVAERFAVKVSGQAETIDALKSAAQSIDLAGLEALKNQGLKQGG